MRDALDPARVRSLPIPVRSLPAETVTGYVHRLALANFFPPQELRIHVTKIAGLAPYRPNLERAAAWVESLGGLPAGHFERDARRNTMHVRCGHYNWHPAPCRHCGYPQQPRSACQRCAGGDMTDVRSRGGAVCNRHRRWHIDGCDIDVAAFPEYLHAERCLSGTLWKRGIGLSTGELQLAATLVHQWTVDAELSDRMRSRLQVLGVASVTRDTALFVAYPEIVNLTTVLTDPSFASYLLSPRFTLAEQVWALEAAVITIMQGSTTPHLHEVAEQIVARGKAAVETAFGMRSKHTRKPATLEKSLVASSQRHRSCLLRHLSTVRLQIPRFEPGVAAPKDRVLEWRRPLPDRPLSEEIALVSGQESSEHPGVEEARIHGRSFR